MSNLDDHHCTNLLHWYNNMRTLEWVTLHCKPNVCGAGLLSVKVNIKCMHI